MCSTELPKERADWLFTLAEYHKMLNNDAEQGRCLVEIYQGFKRWEGMEWRGAGVLSAEGIHCYRQVQVSPEKLLLMAYCILRACFCLFLCISVPLSLCLPLYISCRVCLTFVYFFGLPLSWATIRRRRSVPPFDPPLSPSPASPLPPPHSPIVLFPFPRYGADVCLFGTSCGR